MDFNVWAIIVAAIVAFVLSFGWYMVFGGERNKLLGIKTTSEMKRPQPKLIAIELIRNLVLAHVIAYFIVRLDITTWTSALHVGLLFWLGFPFILLSGSVLWDKVPSKLAVIHAGDWLIKLVAISLILGLWR